GDPRGLALLKVGGDLPDDVQILEWDTQSQLHGGEEVRVIGFPQIGGNPWAVTRGTLSGFDGPILKFSGAVEEGNSGGPLLYRGKVIGVIVEIIRQFGNAKPSQIAQFTVDNWPGFSR
ncbi:MAG: trypsin-like peptidase domain-containing protein, partial [Nitrospira sp.]|nr:trypsin-like peptidase domain-containing protein [Nitrospira sp.]